MRREHLGAARRDRRVGRQGRDQEHELGPVAERALEFEAARQIAALEAGEPLVQETRHWDEDSGTTKTMRSKEEAFDYRYFPEPDIPALEPDEAWIEESAGASRSSRGPGGPGTWTRSV